MLLCNNPSCPMFPLRLGVERSPILVELRRYSRSSQKWSKFGQLRPICGHNPRTRPKCSKVGPDVVEFSPTSSASVQIVPKSVNSSLCRSRFCLTQIGQAWPKSEQIWSKLGRSLSKLAQISKSRPKAAHVLAGIDHIGPKSATFDRVRTKPQSKPNSVDNFPSLLHIGPTCPILAQFWTPGLAKVRPTPEARIGPNLDQFGQVRSSSKLGRSWQKHGNK